MVPEWIYRLIAEERSRTEAGIDEHGQPISDEMPRGSSEHRAFPGFVDYYKLFPKKPSSENYSAEA